jgi:hypothetical protein
LLLLWRYHHPIGTPDLLPPPDRDAISPRAVTLLALVLAGAALALLALPRLFAIVPNDYGRYRVVVRTLKAPGVDPGIIILGDSRGASGLDARQLTRELAGHPLALNLCVPAMHLDDVLMLMQDLPSSARRLVIVIGRDSLVSGNFTPAAYNVMFMAGFRPNDRTIRLMAASFGAEAEREMQRGPLEQTLSSRWVIRHLADRLLYDAFRGRASETRERNDLFFPMPFERRLDPSRFSAAVSILRSGHPSPILSPPSRKLIEAIADSATRAHRRVILVIAPADPRVTGPAPLPTIAIPHLPSLTVVDAESLLNDSDFADPLHPLTSGARKLTILVAQGIGELH